MKALLRRSLVSVVGSVTLLFASTAFAEGEACYNDDDCPNPACGGDVCNWGKTAAKADGMKIFYCQPAGRDPKGMDGWCTTVDNCKCKATAGVMCVQSHCTDTGTPIASGGTGSGGSAAGGSSAGGSSAAGTGTTTAGTGTTTAGTGSTTPAKEDSGGCSVGGSQNSGVATMALVLGALGLGVTLARRRR